MCGNEILAEMLGKTLVSVAGLENGSDCILFVAESGEKWQMMHQRECCEVVEIADFTDDPADLIGAPLLMAEMVSNDDDPDVEIVDSHTWTFVKFATVKGYVTVRWLGISNGYYSEEPTLIRIGEDAQP